MADIHTNTFKLIAVNQLDNSYHFSIPSFQRGYRWGKQEVEDLLSDLTEFADNAEPTYLLQPLVVRKRADSVYDVLDGQQRLTTLRILLHCIGQITGHPEIENNLFSIEYACRNKIDFTRLDQLNWQESPDHFFIYKAYHYLMDYPEKLKKICTILLGENAQNRVQFIWYEIAQVPTASTSDLEAIHFFDKFNRGKIPLTASDLIKALFVLNAKRTPEKTASLTSQKSVPAADEQLVQTRTNLIIAQWDQLEKHFQNPDFFAFAFKPKQTATTPTLGVNTLDDLFNFVTHSHPTDHDRLPAYRYFQQKYNQLDAPSFSKLWESEVLAGFDELLRWYEDVTCYNYIGWLVYCGESIYHIREQLQTLADRAAMYQHLKWLIRKKLCGVQGTLEDLLAARYDLNKELLAKTLLLFNVELYTKANQKFPFAAYYKEKWDLEHVASQHDTTLKEKFRKDWLLWAKQAFDLDQEPEQDPAQQAEKQALREALENSNLAKFDELYKRVGQFYDKKYDLQDDEKKHDISNLVLLDQSTNRSYQNAPFPYKLQCILRKDHQGRLILLGTKNVFLHYYTFIPNGETHLPNLLHWNSQDRAAYKEALKITLQDIFNAKNLKQTATSSTTRAETTTTPPESRQLKSQKAIAPATGAPQGAALTFRQLLSNNYKVAIPSIQREYTYGNTETEITQKRKQFLDFLFQALTGPETQSLDFVYGYCTDGYLEPLDGQQRLTTLFLLEWLFALDAPSSLLDAQGEPRFFYRTRPTAHAFCRALSKHPAAKLLNDWRIPPAQSAALWNWKKESSKASNVRVWNKPPDFADFLQQQNWFLWQWRSDPSIKSMLNMLNDMVARANRLDSKQIHLEHIIFDFLDLENLHIKEDIYIKMNARGKQLSDFDLYKSSLETTLQTAALDETFEEKWRSAVDGNWLQFFWQNYRPQQASSPFENVEKKYLLFWQRLTDLYNNLGLKTSGKYKAFYLKRLYADTNALLYTYEGKMTDISQLLQAQLGNINKPELDFAFDHLNTSLLERMLGQKESRKSPEKDPDLTIKSLFLGMLLFARKYALQLHQNAPTAIQNFKKYMRVLRNILLNDNRNAHLENGDLPKIYKSLKRMLCAFKASKIDDFYQFLDAFDVTGLFSEVALSQEKQKAALRKNDPEWEKILCQAEENNYFRGQVHALLNWANWDKAKFLHYYEKFGEFLNIGADLCYASLLAFEEYPNTKNSRFTLRTWDQHRDYSWKRTLRSGQADILKRFMDAWDAENQTRTQTSQPLLDAAAYAQYVIDSKLGTLTGWRKWLVLSPKALWFAELKCLQRIANHWYLLKRSTGHSSKYEVFLAALYWKLKNFSPKFDTRDELSFSYQGQKYHLKAEPNGLYSLQLEGQIQPPTTDQAIWDYLCQIGCL